MLENNQIYTIVDIELNGKIPGEHSILSKGKPLDKSIISTKC